MYKKPVIVFEGIEGSGKSYHIKNVTNYLKQKKIKFIKLREPGGSLNSEKIRKLILSKKSNFDKMTDFLLYMSSRNENLKIIGLNYKDKQINAEKFLDEFGNPFHKILLDQDGTIAIEWGGIGVPETFLIYKKKILKRYIGPLNQTSVLEIKKIIK